MIKLIKLIVVLLLSFLLHILKIIIMDLCRERIKSVSLAAFKGNQGHVPIF